MDDSMVWSCWVQFLHIHIFFHIFLHILTYSYIFSNIKQDNLTESHHRLFGAQLMNFPATGAEGHHMVAYCGYGKKKITTCTSWELSGLPMQHCNWLVVGEKTLWKMMDFVNWDDESNPILMGKCQKWQPNHQPVDLLGPTNIKPIISPGETQPHALPQHLWAWPRRCLWAHKWQQNIWPTLVGNKNMYITICKLGLFWGNWWWNLFNWY